MGFRLLEAAQDRCRAVSGPALGCAGPRRRQVRQGGDGRTSWPGSGGGRVVTFVGTHAEGVQLPNWSGSVMLAPVDYWQPGAQRRDCGRRPGV